MVREQRGLQEELDTLKARLEVMKTADSEFREADSHRRDAFEELIALQDQYAISCKLYVNDGKYRTGANEARNPELLTPAASKQSTKGKSGTKTGAGAITSPGERSGKGTKGKKEGKKK